MLHDSLPIQVFQPKKRKEKATYAFRQEKQGAQRQLAGKIKLFRGYFLIFFLF
jgi:hypothetical protein